MSADDPSFKPDAESLATRIAELEAENARLRNARKFGLVWEDRPEAVEEAMAERLPILTRKPSLDVPGTRSEGRPHILIEGDNLHALTVLQATHAGSVDVIYIDPPYNTGKEFVYNDKLVGEEDRWRHSAWLSFIDKRLRLARVLLKDSGVILISIDDNEQAHLRLLCDQVFGASNFLATMVWESRPQGGNDSTYYRVGHEYILAYALDKTSCPPTVKLATDRSKYRKRDSHFASRGAYLPTKLNVSGLNYSPSMDFVITAPDGTELVPSGDPDSNVDKWIWRWSEEKVEWGAANDFIEFKRDPKSSQGWTVYSKEYELVDNKGTPLDRSATRKALLTQTGALEFLKPHNVKLSALLGKKAFDNPKPLPLMMYILGAFPSDAVILDFFAGSGTTAHAAAKLNEEDGGTRQVISVTNNENDICREVTQPRIRAALTGKMADGKNRDSLPGSLRFYATDFLRDRRNRDQALIDLARASADIVAVKEGAHNKILEAEHLTVLSGAGKSVAIVAECLSDHSELACRATEAAGKEDRKIAYLFTWADDGIEPELAAQWAGWEVHPLPTPLIAAIRRGANSARRPR